MASRSTNTMIEALQKMNRDIADMKTLPDADMPFLITMENMIIQRMKQPVDNLRADGTLGPQQQAQVMGQMQPGTPQMAPGMGMAAGGLQPGGMMAGPTAPSQDELSRLLSAGATAL